MPDNTENKEIKIGSKANENVTCSQCSKQVLGSQAYTYRGKKNKSIFLCETCREAVEKVFDEETKNSNIVMAVILGLAAAVAAGTGWFFFSILTGYQIGYIAIGVGFLIGWAVIWGSGKKRGAVLQIISAFLTLITLFTSEYFMMLYYYRQYMMKNTEQFPDYSGEWFFISPFNPGLLKDIFSPMGLVIWAIGIYFAYSLPKSRKAKI